MEVKQACFRPALITPKACFFSSVDVKSKGAVPDEAEMQLPNARIASIWHSNLSKEENKLSKINKKQQWTEEESA